jgi:hypothetical protein
MLVAGMSTMVDALEHVFSDAAAGAALVQAMRGHMPRRRRP